MKRKALTPGERFVDDAGTVYEVVSNESGWALSIDGKEHVRDLRYATRYMGPTKGDARYQTNTKIAVVEIRPAGKRTRRVPAVVEPRDLVMTLAEYEAQHSKDAVKQERTDARLQSWQRALKAGGLTAHEVDLESEKVTLSFRQMKKVLANAGVDVEVLR